LVKAFSESCENLPLDAISQLYLSTAIVIKIYLQSTESAAFQEYESLKQSIIHKLTSSKEALSVRDIIQFSLPMSQDGV